VRQRQSSLFHSPWNTGANRWRVPSQVPADHNVLNATAAVAVGVGLDIPADRFAKPSKIFRVWTSFFS